MTLPEFLLARIAEDDAEARAVELVRPDDRDSRLYMDDGGMVKATPARVLAECEAKRQIVELYDQLGGDDADQPHATALRAACMALTLPFADHPDYQEAWKP